ncbi:hypothetical protein GDO86_003750 [Hymenochirus boettgeri]|uniref:Peptidase S54 rhomboid domain-containing protein n=1 Tax=Hymenochirus boettgeri TaxID=247094 RepID=A0A8T2KAZ5_9PIPI|nr:hypothetical protein GDO86_003750 [Hymenochirus boettgeri]
MEEEGESRAGWRKVLALLPRLGLTPGAAMTMLLSLAISTPALLGRESYEVGDARYDLEPGVVETRTVYRLISYIFFHDDLSSLLCSFLIIWYFGGGFEENIGTAKFWFLTPIFSMSSGLLYLALLAVGLNLQANVKVQGFTSVGFAMLSTFTTRSCFSRMPFFGFLVPTKVLPLFFLIIALFIPHAPVLSNVCGILTGVAYGMGLLDFPETMMSRVDHTFPFRLLKRIPIWTYIPASSAERKAAQTRKINPPPGSYPTQQYYMPPQGLGDTYSPYRNAKPGSWPPSTCALGHSPNPMINVFKDPVCMGNHAHLNSCTSALTDEVRIPSVNNLQQVQVQ